MLNLEKIAENYHLKNGVPDMFIENICQEFEFEWIRTEIQQSDKILDLGYGDGLFLKFLKDHKDLTIIEGSKKLCDKAVEQSRLLGSNAKIIYSFFEEFESVKKYDIIIASHVLEHVEDPEILLRKAKDWLAPKGKLIIVVPNAESFHRKLGVVLNLQEKLDDLSPRDHEVGHLRVFTLETLKDLVSYCGFKISKERGFFLKVLSNAQMLDLEPKVIEGLCKLSTELSPSYGANIGIVAQVTS